LKIATFNLFNYLEPPFAYYDFENIYSSEQWAKKQRWIANYLADYQPDIIGFQEVFSPESLRVLVAELGYDYFAVVDQAEVVDDFICRSPVVAIASRYPIVVAEGVAVDTALAVEMGLDGGFSFSRKVLRATIDLPHVGHCDCYVVHFKSKRPAFEHLPADTLSIEQNTLATLKAEIAGGWSSSIQRGSEAALLLTSMIERRQDSGLPMILLGDFNTPLADGVLSHLLTSGLRTGAGGDVREYVLKDSWDLFQSMTVDQQDDGETLLRQPSHYYAGAGLVLDYVLLSCEFDAGFQGSLFEVSDHATCDRHLINPLFERDGQSTDHGIVLVTLSLRD
jgi:endonuclease/exonuclease/phosphatase family metal-dependent hydrolase